MRNLNLLAVALCIFASGSVKADQLVSLTVNTTSLAGTSGSLDFAFNSGALVSQPASVQVLNFTGATFGGTKIDSGAASGGPVSTPVTIGNNSAFQSNDDFETVTFGKSLAFTLDFGGPAVNSPNGQATSTSQFAFYLFSDANGTVPVLTSDPNGVIGLVTVNLNGTLSTSAVSPNAAFAAAAPEPATLGLMSGAFGMIGLAGLARRRSSNR